MIQLESVLLVLLVSLTVSLPTCDISYWVNSEDACSGTPNGTHSLLTFNGNCTPSPDDPKETSYKLNINTELEIVDSFTVYKDNACRSGDEMLITKTPLLLSNCGPLLFMTDLSSSVRIGSLIFNCNH